MKIDKGIPIGERGERATYPFAQMEVGDSFFLLNGEVPLRRLQTRIASASRYYRFISNGTFAVKTKTVDENGVKGVRVWRVS